MVHCKSCVFWAQVIASKRNITTVLVINDQFSVHTFEFTPGTPRGQALVRSALEARA